MGELELSLRLIWAEKLLKDVLKFIDGTYYKPGFYPTMKYEILQWLSTNQPPPNLMEGRC
jgi:hypothetical protein